MNIIPLMFALAVGVSQAGRVPRQFDFYSQFPFGDYISQFPEHPAAFAQETYPYSAQSSPYASALCKLIPAAGQQVGGEIYFHQADSIGPVEVTVSVFGLTPGLHGFHIHQNGNVSDNCKAAGSHFNPANKNHGSPKDAVRHAGDLGNIEADAHGFANAHIVDQEISLVDQNPRQIVGRAVVIHAKEDDLGKGNNSESLKTGNAGSRVACCVIQATSYGKK
ncbi:UNVERIFIED_CONTAM: hypothetical protein PYX00_009155 [Menopon gallinae]|uniref:Superoxide dismutase [Cu-Zn] n=1 Tax=Menopon gallinae TaxID=328185 RepID=A0AAW2HA54_9NEOP